MKETNVLLNFDQKFTYCLFGQRKFLIRILNNEDLLEKFSRKGFKLFFEKYFKTF